jgi:hypothetical protein
MPQNIRRRLFGRVVLWEPNGGTVIDLPSRNVLSFGGPSESEEYVRLASGDREVISRSYTVQIPITSVEGTEVIESLQRNGSKIKASFVGIKGTDTFMWLEPTKVQVTDPEVSAGDIGRKVVELNTNVFYPAIWDGMSILEGIPWRGTESKKDGIRFVLRPNDKIRPGYDGPLWECPGNSFVDIKGATSGITSSEEASVKVGFPVSGCKLKIESKKSFDAKILSFNSAESLIRDSDYRGNSNKIVLPENTFYVGVEIYNSESPVRLLIEEIGSPEGLLVK